MCDFVLKKWYRHFSCSTFMLVHGGIPTGRGPTCACSALAWMSSLPPLPPLPCLTVVAAHVAAPLSRRCRHRYEGAVLADCAATDRPPIVGGLARLCQGPANTDSL